MIKRLARHFEAPQGLTDDFFVDTLKQLLDKRVLTRDMSILVVTGGPRDRKVLHDLNFTAVTISNLDVRFSGTEFAPFSWSYQNVENLTFENDAFDFSIVHNGLHHCHSPHRGLLEMYRVSRRGVLVFEPRDTFLVRLGVRFGFGQDYEHHSVSHNGMQFGGVGNTQIPNFIYRWTEDEVRKTITTYSPVGRHNFHFFYALRVPWGRLRMLRNRFFFIAIVACLPVLNALFRVVPKQSNAFAFAVCKPRVPDDVHPWLKQQDGELVVNEKWLEARYNVKK